MHIYADQSEDSSVDFLNRLERAAPMKIVKLLTDNGSQFTDRFTSKKREPSGQHKFDVRCRALNIEHRLCPPRHPQTNGMVERFNARISEVVNQTRFASAADLEATLHQYVKTYNHLIPQRALKHISPVQALKDWHAKKPELFKKRVYNQPGLDTQAHLLHAVTVSHSGLHAVVLQTIHRFFEAARVKTFTHERLKWIHDYLLSSAQTLALGGLSGPKRELASPCLKPKGSTSYPFRVAV